MYVCVCFCKCECVCECVRVRGTEREGVIGQNSLRSSLGEDYFILREIVCECEDGRSCGVCCRLKIF